MYLYKLDDWKKSKAELNIVEYLILKSKGCDNESFFNRCR
jgi:hypothetical protein